MCARHEPRILFGGNYLSRDIVTTDDNKYSRNMGEHSRTIRYGYPRPRRMVGPTRDNIHATVGSRTWNPHSPPMFERVILENPVQLFNIQEG